MKKKSIKKKHKHTWKIKLEYETDDLNESFCEEPYVIAECGCGNILTEEEINNTLNKK